MSTSVPSQDAPSHSARSLYCSHTSNTITTMYPNNPPALNQVSAAALVQCIVITASYYSQELSSIVTVYFSAAVSGKNKQQLSKTVVKPSPRQPGSAGEGQEKCSKSAEVSKATKAPPTSPTKQDKPVSGTSSSSPGKNKANDRTTTSPKKGPNKNTESHNGGKGSPSKRAKLSFGQKPVVVKPLDSATRRVVSLSVPAPENGLTLYKGVAGFSSVAILKVVARQRKKLQTWPPIMESEDEEESDSELSDEDDEDWEEYCTGGGRKRAGGSRDDVVHCVCGSEVDEGFMIQVSLTL